MLIVQVWLLQQKTQRALEKLRSTLAAEDRIILNMFYKDGFKVAQIARALHLDQKSLYRRIDKILRNLRNGFEDEGIRAEDVRELFRQNPGITRATFDGEPQTHPASRKNSKGPGSP